MRLVWVVIPLVLIGIIGVSESFAEISDITYDVMGGEILEITYGESSFNDIELVIKIHMTENGQIILDVPKSVWNLSSIYCEEHPSGILLDNKSPWLKDHPMTENNLRYYVDVDFSEDIEYAKRIFTIEVPVGTQEIKIVKNSSSIYDVLEDGKRCFLIEQTKDFTPKNQIDAGVLPKDVTCHENLLLAINSQNNFAACVKPDTLIKLHDRGWAKNSVEIGKVWVELSPITCRAHDCDIEWLNSYDLAPLSWPYIPDDRNYNCILAYCLNGTSFAVKDHFGNVGIEILDIKYEAHPHWLIGEFGESAIQHSFFFLIPSSDLVTAVKEGLVINPENNLNRNGVFPETWTFAEYEKVPYWVVNRNYFYSDENCSGYILRPNGDPMSHVYDSLIREGKAKIDFENCPFYEQSKFQIYQLANILDVIESTELAYDEKLDYFQLIHDEKFAPTISNTDRNLFQQTLENYHKGDHVRLLREQNMETKIFNVFQHLMKTDNLLEKEKLDHIVSLLQYKSDMDITINSMITYIIDSDNLSHEEKLTYFTLLHDPSVEIKIFDVLEHIANQLNDDEKLEYIILLHELQEFSNIEYFIKMNNQFLQGDDISFQLTELGFSNTCTAPNISVFQVKGHPQAYQIKDDTPLYTHQLTYSCDKLDDTKSPILNYYTHENFPDLPRCIELGEHWIVNSINATHSRILANYSCVEK